MLRHPPLRLYAIAWVPLLAVYMALYMGAGSRPAAAIRTTLLTILPFALLGLLVLRVPRRVPWNDDRRAAFFAAQLGLTTAFAVAAAGAVIASWTLESFLTTGRAVFPAPPVIAAWQAVIGGLIYLAIAGAAYAWQNAQRVREEAARAAQADALRARAELAALRSQLNPHFLLNTLHAALGLVRRDPERAERALERLGEVLHYGLRMHRESLDQVSWRTSGRSCGATWRSRASGWKSACSFGWKRTRRRCKAWCPPSSCSRWSRTRSSTPVEGGGVRATIDLPLDREAVSEPA